MFSRLIEGIERGKRNIESIAGKHIHQPPARFLCRLGSGRCREIAQHTQPAFTNHSLSHLRHDAEHAGDATIVVIDRTIGEGVVTLLGKPISLKKERQTLIPCCPPLLENPLDARTNVGPDLLPNLVRSGTEHPIALHTDGGQISVIAKKGEFRPPKHPHRIARVEHDAHDRFERLRPRRHRPERRLRPIERTHALAHLTATRQEVGMPQIGMQLVNPWSPII